MKTIKYLLFGVVMGVANVIPGVSGGTMAVILNFYDKLMECITLDFRKIRENLDFLIPLAVGIAIAVIGLSKIMQFLLNSYTTQTYFAFIGIVFGSLNLIYSSAKKEKIKTRSYIPFIITFMLMLYLSFANADKETASTVIKYTTLNTESFMMCFIAMAVATVTMIIPGISGALVLIIMGMYGTIIGFVIAEFNIPLLIPSGLGGIFGLLGGAGLVRFLLKNFHQETYMAILGLLIGSIVQLYVNSNVILILNVELITSLFAMAIMFLIVYWFSNQDIKEEK
jgi:putative membrane protein